MSRHFLHSRGAPPPLADASRPLRAARARPLAWPQALTLTEVHQAIITCERCPGCGSIASGFGQEKRRRFREETYWARPVPGFGDPRARVLILGLAPAAHGANRTGRVFTGDGGGGSGRFP